MRSSTGRWVSGQDFFDRERELRVLETRILDRNHVLLTGQRRMGKTSILRELGRRLEFDGWVLLFADVEGASCAEDAIAEIARAVHPVRPIARRFASGMKRWVSENVEEVSAHEFGVKIRGGLDAGSWRSLERLYSLVLDDAPASIADALEVLVHDGYLEGSEGGYRFSSRLLRDWWSARFRDHHVALEVRSAHDAGGAQVQ